jgi:hypothetical protein
MARSAVANHFILFFQLATEESNALTIRQSYANDSTIRSASPLRAALMRNQRSASL